MPSVASVTFPSGHWIVGMSITEKVAFLRDRPTGKGARYATVLEAGLWKIPGLESVDMLHRVVWAYFSIARIQEERQLKFLLERCLRELAPEAKIPIGVQPQWYVRVEFRRPVPSRDIVRVNRMLHAMKELDWRYEEEHRVLIVRRTTQPPSELKHIFHAALTF